MTQTKTRRGQASAGGVGRLPAGATATEHRVLKGLAALVGSLLLLVGVPVFLVVFFGNPLPTGAPSRAWLTADVSAGMILDVLAVLVWVVWVHFVVCFLTEWRAVRAGRMPDRVVMGGSSQTLARQLVAGVLLLAGGASIATGVSSAFAADRAAEHETQRAAISQVAADAAGAVEAGEQQREQAADAGGAAALKMTTVKLPEGRHHDTLWGIAERTLGDPLRYKEIYELNKGRLQPDGSRLNDADLIRPGWNLILPADAAGPGIVLASAPTTPPQTAPGQGGSQGGGSAQGAGAAVQADAARGGGAQVDGAGGAVSGAHEGTAGLGTMLLGGGLVLAGVLRALTARRGLFGEPDADEGALRLAANTHRASFLDTALRVLAESRAAQGLPMPDLSVVYVDDDKVIAHVVGHAAAPERPWTASEDGSSWIVSASALAGLTSRAPAPYPALVNIATSHEFDVLIDLEYAGGLVAVGGDDTVSREVAMSTVVDLATHAWSDAVDVSMVGFASDLSEIAPARVRGEQDLDAALTRVEQQQAEASALLSRLGVDGVLAGRSRARHDELQPRVLVLSAPPSPEQVQRIRRLASSGRAAFAALCVGDAPGARWRFGVDGQGAIDLGVLGVSGEARRYTMAAHQKLTAMLSSATASATTAARQVDESVPATIVAATGERPDDPTNGPTGGAAGRQAAAQVLLLGPVEVRGPGSVDAGQQPLLTELATMAALHPQGLHDAVLTSGLWPRGVSDDVVARTIELTQAWLGTDATGRPRLWRGDDGLWHLSDDVYVDWADLQRSAREAGSVQELSQAHTLARGLELARGEAFSVPEDGRYGWLTFHRAGRNARLVITSMAARAAGVLAANHDRQGAEEALRRGLALVPEAETLWRDLIRLKSGPHPDGTGAADVVAEMRRRLPGHAFEGETEALVATVAPSLAEKATS